jgi:hypothetical protein
MAKNAKKRMPINPNEIIITRFLENPMNQLLCGSGGKDNKITKQINPSADANEKKFCNDFLNVDVDTIVSNTF